MKDCIFCKIVKREAVAKVIYEDDELLAFQDIAPQAPIHFLVIPKGHISNLMELKEEDTALMGRLIFVAQRLAVQSGCAKKGARFVINCKSFGGQTIDHLHVHVLGGRPLTWPPG